MAGPGQINSTFDTSDSRSNRETLADWVDRITPAETPLYSLIGDETVEGIKPEWQTDTLGTPDTDNAHVEGEIYTYDTIQATARVANYTQIFRKSFIVSDTQEKVKKAGKTSDLSYERLKRGQEIKIDIETAFLSNQASIAGSASVPRRLGGLRAWLSTNDSMGAGGASGGYNAATGVVDAAINGTKRAFSKNLLDEAISSAYTAGGNPTVGMGSPYVKRVFSTFMADSNVAPLRVTASANSQATLVGAADAYLSDFGLLDIVPNRQMARTPDLARNFFLLDTDKLSKGWLRRIHEDKNVARTSDGQPVVIIGEVTLMVKNEAAHAVVADLNGIGIAA